MIMRRHDLKQGNAASTKRRSQTAEIWHNFCKNKGAIVGLVASVICAVVMAIIGNLVITPAYLGVPMDAVVAMILPILVPFNLLKGIINAVLTLAVYKSISNLITPRKQQVKGR